jgi:hypothetical protein
MSRAFVLGNGQSRHSLDLELIASLGPIYGCNALYRDHMPTVLVATDRPIAEHIQSLGVPLQTKFYTRKPLPNSGALRVPQKYFGFSSGPIAVALAAQHGARAIYLLGFDMGGNETGHFNNVYASTEFYKKASAQPTYSGNWTQQLITVMRDFPDRAFYRVAGTLTAAKDEFKTVSNLATMPMTDFLNRINNTKEL